MMKSPQSLLALASLLLAPLSAMAAGDAPNYTEDTLTGDWDGARGAMAQKGVTLDIGYKLDLLRNIGGGIERGGRPMSHLDFKLAANFEKLAGWQGGSGFVDFIQDQGGKINALQVGSLTGVSNIEVPVNTHRLFQAWLQQEFADGRASLLAGIYPIDSEFQVLETGGLFLEPPYGPNPDLSQTRGPSIFNNADFGVRGKWFSADRGAYVQGAVLDGIPDDPANPRGTDIKFNKGDGTMSIVEIGLKPGAVGSATTPLEDAWEATYRIQAGKWLAVQPVIQRIDHPGGLASRAAASIVRARVEVSF